MKVVYALTLCLGIADAVVLPVFSAPKGGYALPRPDSDDTTDSSKTAAGSKTNLDSMLPVFGKAKPKTGFPASALSRRVARIEQTYGSDDESTDDSDDTPTDPSDATPSSPPDDTPSGSSDDIDEVVYAEPFMQPTYVRFGPAPVDKPEVAPKAKSNSKDTASVAKHGVDDDSSSGGHKQKGKDKNKGKDDATKSRKKPEDSPKTSSNSATDSVSVTATSTAAPTSPPKGDDKGKSKGKGKGKGKDGGGRHNGDDDATKSRTKVEDSTKTRSSAPTKTYSDDSGKGKGKGKGDGKGRHDGGVDATKSRAKAEDSETNSKKSSKKGSKDDSKSKPSKKSFITHQSGKTFDADSTKGGGKNGPGYNPSFDVPKLNKGYIQAIPPKASTINNKFSSRVKPRPQLNTEKVRPLSSSSSSSSSSLLKRDESKNILSLRAAAPFNSAAIDRKKWSVTCDSVHEGDDCKNAIDGNGDTMWHTQWEGSEPAPPHSITVDMKKSYNVNGISMLPRQDGSQNGYIAQHQIFLSKDGKTWGSPVAYGNWYSDWTVKYANFDTQPARFVKLVALTEANGNPWTSIAELNVFQANDYVPPQASQGAWGPTINFPIIPVAGAVDPNTGKVLVWSSWARDTMSGGPGGLTLTSTWDPATGQVAERQVTETNHDMFCPGISLDGNGQLVVTGGNNAERTSLFDPVQQAWVSGPNMQVARGYQSSATTSTGKVFTIGGSWSGGESFKNGEVYDPKKKTWTLLNKADVQKMLTNDAQGLFRSDNHAWLFGWKSGTVFQAGPSKNMNWYYTEKKNGDVKTAGQRASDRGIAPDAMCGNAIMFDAVKGKILTHGGTPNYQDSDATTDAHIITVGNPGANVSVAYASEGLFFPRVFHSSVVLPNGNVFITGGQQYAVPFEDSTPQLQPEMYYPDRDVFELMKPNNIVRTYHSIALLLPDGRVFNGGGGLCGGCDTNHFDAQLYTPPYLYDSKGKLATRPKITSVSVSTIKVGGTVTVQTGGAIVQASLVRYGTATHTVNSDQRRIPLTLANAGKNSYSFQVPSDPGVALPGYWMLFVMDKNGVPSVASTIKVTGS
ncbi:Galactose oxidase [Fusarium oxysporum f. sp. cepae]|uniref:Galactose oxidase n=2 Tax=Fusarium oxysporum TaxID=5507 RepID=A0A3L6P4W5_FUSOX|nr:Galactose oxidase [Fusarium oxysporum f. sp. cepae]RKK56846.1 Galactose oxidase [Fusarium oxysporum f. sp. cepae]RKK63491.1 Galactose oxidase [Fusarium oxysporum f. sp. cepae]